jgi:hypothetical protein
MYFINKVKMLFLGKTISSSSSKSYISVIISASAISARKSLHNIYEYKG